MKIVERKTTVKKKYGGITGKTLKSTNVSIIETDEQFTVDYDLAPMYYDQLTTAEKSEFEYSNYSYNLSFLGNIPNFNYEYYSMIPSDIRSYYY